MFAREAPAGNVAVIPNGLKVCLGQRTVLIRSKMAVFDSDFLASLLLTPQMQQRLVAHSKGATVKHINMKDIRALDVGAIPSLDVQRVLARIMSDVSNERERLETIYQQKLTALDNLKKSLLHQAFSGQL
ncbi:MAG: restriction endonuclease subunit S [Pseudomonadales bacterium]